MIEFIKYFSSSNFIDTTYQVVGNIFTIGANSNFLFEQLYKWKSYKDGFEEAKVTKKPIFFLFYKPLCPACLKLKEKCSKSMRLMDLSSRFVMIKANMEENTILNDTSYQPDGKYVPRILFFTPDGEFIKEAYNKHPTADKEHKYFYSNPSQLVETMLFVLKEYSRELLPVTFEHDRSTKLENCNTEDDVLTPTLLE